MKSENFDYKKMEPVHFERNEYVEGELQKMLDGAASELEKIKEGVGAGEFTPEQCTAIHNKLQAFFVGLANEGLRPDFVLKPKSRSNESAK